MHKLLTLVTIVLGTASAFSPHAVAQLEQVTNVVPASANAVMIVDVESAYASPLANDQGWAQSMPEAYRSGMIGLPQSAKLFLMAAEMDFEFLQPVWEISAAYITKPPTMATIASRSGAEVERIAGTEVVERPNDSAVAKLGPRVLGAHAPANRQQLTRWIRNSRRRKAPQFSDYLQQSISRINGNENQIVLALDVAGLTSAGKVANFLSTAEDSPVEKGQVNEISELVASLQGLCLEVQLAASPSGRLTLTFESPIEVQEQLAREVFLFILAHKGGQVEDLKQWIPRVSGNELILEGMLSEYGLRRVLSLLSSPVGPLSASASASTSEATAVADATQKYYVAITSYLNDLFYSGRRPDSMHQAKLWIQRYARKISDLDTYNVDEDVLAFAQEAIDALYEVEAIIDRTQRRTDLQDANLYNSGRRRYGRYGAYGYFEKSYAARDRQAVELDNAGRGLQEIQRVVNQLRVRSTQTGQSMSQRYDRKF